MLSDQRCRLRQVRYSPFRYNNCLCWQQSNMMSMIIIQCVILTTKLVVFLAILSGTNQIRGCHSFSLPAVAGTSTTVTTPTIISNPTGTSSPIRTGKSQQPIVVYTIAGSDSGGGAGIQADLKTIFNFRCYGCSIITCLTAQNSHTVSAVHTPPTSFIQEQWNAVFNDIKPYAIKIGMLGSKEMVLTVGVLLKELRAQQQVNSHKNNHKIWIVLDPVMISTSGSRLIDYDAQKALIDHVFPYVDLITPNLYEAEALLSNNNDDDGDDDNNFKITSNEGMEIAAAKLMQLGCKAVLVKGGHFYGQVNMNDNDESESTVADNTARDYLLIRSTTDNDSPSASANDRRLCDADVTMKINEDLSLSAAPTNDRKGVWFHSVRYDTVHTHGTGCTMSAAIASALAIGESCRRNDNIDVGGADIAMDLVDAVCLAKAYVTAGISQSQALNGAKGPGPVAHTTFPNSYHYYPTIHKKATRPIVGNGSFKQFGQRKYDSQHNDNYHPQLLLSRVLPIVDSVDWIERLCKVKELYPNVLINDVQLRIKNEVDPERILNIVTRAQTLCTKANIRLWINDYWEAAIVAKCFGVHLGQEDLYRCINDGGIDRMRQTNSMALGISTHTYGELAAALGIVPSYISLGPIFATGSKKVQFEPQGLDVLHQWRLLIPPNVPLVAIGGINDADIASDVRIAGADCIAVIGAVTKDFEYELIAKSIMQLEHAMER